MMRLACRFGQPGSTHNFITQSLFIKKKAGEKLVQLSLLVVSGSCRKKMITFSFVIMQVGFIAQIPELASLILPQRKEVKRLDHFNF